MNERIRQLVKEAESVANEGIGFDGQEYTDILMAKFAELIVRECAKEADKQNIFCRGVPWGNWVKKHFGVEE
jgi:hypothetical protein